MRMLKLAPSKFMKKIPNMTVMREFFISKCKYYCKTILNNIYNLLGPPKKDLNALFIKDILSGKKSLLKNA